MNISKLRELERAANEAEGTMGDRMIARWKYMDAAVNALPALMKVAEAAEAYRDCSMDDIAKFEKTYKALCEALAELERA